MRHNVATCKTPKMSNFKMGLKSNKGSVRLSDRVRQVIYFKGKAIFADIRYCYSHNDGTETGKIVVSNKEYHVTKNNGIWSVNK